MMLQLTDKCPKCADPDSSRIPKKWYMRLIPFTKRYHCHNCGNDYAVNFGAMILLMPIIIPIKFITWILWDLSGLRFFWQKIRPPINSPQQRRPASTFSIWVIGLFVVYIILFNFASQRYESRIAIFENKIASTLPILAIGNIDERKYALEKISKIQNVTYPDKPNIYQPMSIFSTFFEPADHKYEEIIDLLKNTVAGYKDYIDSVDLERTEVHNPNRQGSEPNNDDLSVTNVINAYIRDQNHTSSESEGD